MDGDSSDELLRLTADDPLGGLSEWVADGRVDGAARERARERWLARQAGEDASLAGVLLDLAEQGSPVTVRTRGGSTARGPVVALGADFAVVRESTRGDIVIPLTAVATVRRGPGGDATIGARPVGFAMLLAEALVELAADHPLVLISAEGDDLRGELRSAGTDLVTLAAASARRDVVHVAVAAIDTLVVLRR